MVFSSTATRPTLAPASIAMLHTVIRPSMDIFSKTVPANSIACPFPPAVPIWPIIERITSFGVRPSDRSPLTVMRIFFIFFVTKHWVAKTCSTSDVPIPWARQPIAPCVAV